MNGTRLVETAGRQRSDGETLVAPRHSRATGLVPAAMQDVFAFLDDPARLSGHMTRRSWMMGGGRMDIRPDAAGGKRAGSEIALAGAAFGMPIEARVVVTEHAPPARKAWRTVGRPKLLVVGPYRMSFELRPARGGTQIDVLLEYALPSGITRLLGWLLGGVYARWCTRRMVEDAVRRFEA